MSRTAAIAALVLLVLAAGGAAFYHFALPGLSSARPTPPVIETEVATWLLFTAYRRNLPRAPIP
jgi:ABC-type microcin C transport system permease subunit YejB